MCNGWLKELAFDKLHRAASNDRAPARPQQMRSPAKTFCSVRCRRGVWAPGSTAVFAPRV